MQIFETKIGVFLLFFIIITSISPSIVLSEDLLNEIYKSDSWMDRIKFSASPKAYWQKKVDGYNWSVKHSSGYIKELELEYKGVIATRDIDLEQAVIFAKTYGLDPIQARNDSLALINDELRRIKVEIIDERALLIKHMAQLEISLRELANYK